VLGVGASAFDNAAAALEAGAARVDLCFRRPEIPRINPRMWMNFSGMLGHFAELTDLERWRFMRYVLEERPVPPTQDSFWRCRRFANFVWHPNSAWHSVHDSGGVVRVKTEAGPFTFDFIIFATGVETSLSARSELTSIAPQIALWRDRFTPPPGEESELLARHPYLGTAFEFMERELGTAPFLARLHNFTFGAMPSLGLTGAAIPGIRYGVRRLVNGLARDLFKEDAAEYYRDLLAYAAPELETLETAVAWVERFATEAVDFRGLIHDLDPALLAKVSRGERKQNPNDQHSSGGGHIRPQKISARLRAKRGSKKENQRPPRGGK
jgi:cation diffusion facilitator CzcD-associated flavoprotein CzcO